MPNDIYRWNRNLVHHCPFCFTPLNTPQTTTTCLGQHVEWCKRYHTQLFKKGTSSQCDACRRGDEEHLKRHREIAEKIHELKQLKVDPSLASPLTTRSLNALSSPTNGSPLTKKERKAAKKVEKVAKMAKVVSSADIEFVATVLHPGDLEAEDIEIERQLLNDPDFKLNRSFHKGTSNTTEMRRTFIKKRKVGGKEESHVDPKEIDGLLQLLNTGTVTANSSMEERKLVQDIRKNIEEDLIKEQHEKDLMMVRKGGFWRWASKRAYKRLVENGKIWSDKDDSKYQSSKSDDATSTSSAVGGAEQEVTEAGSDGNRSEDGISYNMKAFKLDAAPTNAQAQTPRTIKDENDGWTTVGKAATPKTPAGNLKFSHNTGLPKMANTPRRGAHFSYSKMLGHDTEA